MKTLIKTIGALILTLLTFTQVACRTEIELEKYFKGDDLLMAEAIRKEDVKAIGDLSEKVDINGKFKEGLTFLLFAMSEGKFKSGQALLDHGADPLLVTRGPSPGGVRSPRKRNRVARTLFRRWHGSQQQG